MVKSFAPTFHSNLSSYLAQVNSFPILTESEEHELGLRWLKKSDMQAAQKLVTSHLRLVVKVAGKFSGYNLPLVDLISEGNLGLMKAVKKFDPKKGFRLATYAVWWIRAAIQDYILQFSSSLKISSSAAQKKIFFNLNKVKNKVLSNDTEKDIDNNMEARSAESLIAGELGVSDKQLYLVSNALHYNNSSIDDIENSGIEATIANSSPCVETSIIESHEKSEKSVALKKAIATLNERERKIFIARHLEEKKQTLEELSKIYSVSRERIRQIESNAFIKVQKYMKSSMPEG